MKKIIPLCVEGAKILDICLEGDKLIEQGTGAVWNKSVKGVKVSKGEFQFTLGFVLERSDEIDLRSRLPHIHQRE